MTVRLHAPTIAHVREMLASSRAELPVDAEDIPTRGAAVIAHDVMTAVDGMLAALATPPCAACAAKAKKGEGA